MGRNKVMLIITVICIIGIALVSWSMASTLAKTDSNALGLAEYEAGNYEEAIEHYNKAIESDPNNAEVYHNRGLAYFKLGKMGWGDVEVVAKAIPDYTKAIELNPGYADAYYHRGLAYEQFIHYHYKPFDPEVVDCYNKALADFDKVLELDATYVTAHAGKGNIYYRAGEFEKGIQEYDKALESEDLIVEKSGNVGLAEVYYSKARTLKQIPGQIQETISTFDRASEIGLTPIWEMKMLFHQACDYKFLGEYNKALQNYNTITGIAGFEESGLGAYVFFTRGIAYYSLEEYDKAITDFKMLCETPLEASGRKYLGMSYSKIGEDEATVNQEFEKAVELYSAAIAAGEGATGDWARFELMTAYSDRGFCYLCLEEYDKAVSDLEKALESDQNHVHPHFGEHYYLEAYKNLGTYYSQVGEKEKARDYFQAGLNLAEEQCLDSMTVAKELEELLSQL
jgi:tetratricopeptide (TPR) repeat protein